MHITPARSHMHMHTARRTCQQTRFAGARMGSAQCRGASAADRRETLALVMVKAVHLADLARAQPNVQLGLGTRADMGFKLTTDKQACPPTHSSPHQAYRHNADVADRRLQVERQDHGARLGIHGNHKAIQRACRCDRTG